MGKPHVSAVMEREGNKYILSPVAGDSSTLRLEVERRGKSIHQLYLPKALLVEYLGALLIRKSPTIMKELLE